MAYGIVGGVLGDCTHLAACGEKIYCTCVPLVLSSGADLDQTKATAGDATVTIEDDGTLADGVDGAIGEGTELGGDASAIVPAPASNDMGGVDGEHDPLMFYHTADLHLAPRSGTILKRDAATGRLMRDLDMDAAFVQAVDKAVAARPMPSAFVVSGDIFDTYAGSPDAFVTVVREFRRLTDAGIAVIAIAGNHDTPTNALRTPMFAMLQSVFAGNGLVTLSYDRIVRVVVGDIEYVLLPHRVCLDGGFGEDDVRPSGNAPHSVLLVHGVAAGDPSLRQMDEAKEIPIAKWILDLGWDYVAFGHYHKPGWIPGYEGKASYSGSLENTVISGPDVCAVRGPIVVDMRRRGTDGFRTMSPVTIRPIVSLPTIACPNDGDDSSSAPSATALDGQIADEIAGNPVHGAIVLLRVTGVPRVTYKALPRRNWQACDETALFVRVSFDFAEEGNAVPTDAGDDADGSDDDGRQDAGTVAIRPLPVEAEAAVDRLVANGTIPQRLRERVMSEMRQLLSE